jgi:hypothetical protein
MGRMVADFLYEFLEQYDVCVIFDGTLNTQFELIVADKNQ